MNICESICPCNQCDTEPEDCELAKAYERNIKKKPEHVRQTIVMAKPEHDYYYCANCGCENYYLIAPNGAKNNFCGVYGQAQDWAE